MAEDTPNPVMPPEDPAKIMNRVLPPEAITQGEHSVSAPTEDV